MSRNERVTQYTTVAVALILALATFLMVTTSVLADPGSEEDPRPVGEVILEGGSGIGQIGPKATVACSYHYHIETRTVCPLPLREIAGRRPQ